MARTTPARCGRFSLMTLLAHPDLSQMSALCCQTAEYAKALPTFADALALVRRWWMALHFQTSPLTPDP